MAVFSTNLIIYAHTDFEQTFLLEDNQSNSAKDLTGFTATARMKRQFAGGQLYPVTVQFPNRPLLFNKKWIYPAIKKILGY